MRSGARTVPQRRIRAAVLCAALCASCTSDPPAFDTPESVLHDELLDVCLVSNVVGAALAKDGDGYLCRVLPDGGGERHWIRGGRDGVVLNAPKGLAVHGDVLWVADIDVLRRFDRRSGRPLGDVAIPGAACLDDVGVAPDGTVYCTDRGLDAQFAPTGTDAIWRVGVDGGVSPLIQGVDLGQPSGLVAREQGVYVVSWRDGAFFQVDTKGRRTDLGRSPRAQLDGLVRVETMEEGGTRTAWYATSWAGRCVYRFDTSGVCTQVAGELDQPADCGYDGRRRQLLVPLSGQDRLARLPL